MTTVLLLFCSNIFMTYAWYGHLRDLANRPWFIVALVAWGVAFFYCFAVPANRIGYGRFTGAQLKIIQEAVTLIVFAAFSVWYLREQFRWNYGVGFVLIVLAVAVMFYKP